MPRRMRFVTYSYWSTKNITSCNIIRYKRNSVRWENIGNKRDTNRGWFTNRSEVWKRSDRRDSRVHRSQHRHAFVFLPWAKEHACTLLAAKSRIKNLSCDIRSERKSYQRGRGIGAVARSWKRFVRKRFDAKRQPKHTVLGVVSRFAFLLRTATCGGCYREYISVARKEEINSQQAVKKSVPKACAPSPW